MIQDLLAQLHSVQQRYEKLEHQLQQLLRHRFGQRADRLDADQLALFALEVLRGAAEDTDRADADTSEAARSPKRHGHGRKRLPKDLPRRRIEHPIPPEAWRCLECGRKKVRIGEEVSEQLEYEPASLYVIEHVRPKVACRHCESGVLTAEKPMQPIEKGLPGPGLLAHIVTCKYADHLPLHRLEGTFQRHGVEIPRSTTCGWMRACADLLEPLHDMMKAEVLDSKVIHTDDTPLPVLDKQRTKTRTGRMWVYIGDRQHPYTVYDYTASRKRDGPAEFLKDFAGYLQADAFAGYDGIYLEQDVQEVACWSHARRKLIDAQSSDPQRSVTAAAWIRKLYDVEKEARDRKAPERKVLRQEKAKPLLDGFGEWLREESKRVLPKSPIGQAISYTLSNWEALNRYLGDGDLAIDNNAAERALRGVVLGRKNWLFAGSDNGGRTAAVLTSFTATCKARGIDPLAYLRDVLGRISAHPMRRLAELLPDRWKALREAQAEQGASPPAMVH